MSGKITAHFTYAEVLGDGGYTSVPPALVNNVLIAAEGLEAARALLGGKAITPTSWLRTPENNAEVGGAVKSGHTQGLAVDFKVSGLSPSQVMAALAPHVAALGIDQLIEYTTHVHASFDPRRRAQLLIAHKREGADTTYTPWTGEHTTRPAVPTGTMPQTPQTGGTANAKVIAWVGVAIAILELIRRALTGGSPGVTP
jgi:zinc D-Ala-D-Ala carboxypeptidase